MKTNIRELLISAQTREQDGFEKLLAQYKPLLLKEAVIDGVFDEDIYQEYCMVFYRCVQNFSVEYDD